MNINAILNPAYPPPSQSEDRSSTAQQATAVGLSLTPTRNPMALSVLLGQNIACQLRSQSPGAKSLGIKRRADSSPTAPVAKKAAPQASSETDARQRAQQLAKEEWNGYRNKYVQYWLPPIEELSAEDQDKLVEAVLNDNAAAVSDAGAAARGGMNSGSSFAKGKHASSQVDLTIRAIVKALPEVKTFSLGQLKGRVDNLLMPGKEYAAGLLQQLEKDENAKYYIPGRVKGGTAIKLDRSLTFLKKLEEKTKAPANVNNLNEQSVSALLKWLLRDHLPSEPGGNLTKKTRVACVKELKKHFPHDITNYAYEVIEALINVDIRIRSSRARAPTVEGNPIPNDKLWSDLHNRYNKLSSCEDRAEFKKLYNHRNEIPNAEDRPSRVSDALKAAMTLLGQREKMKKFDGNNALVAKPVKAWAQDLLDRSLGISECPKELTGQQRDALTEALAQDPVVKATGIKQPKLLIPLIHSVTALRST